MDLLERLMADILEDITVLDDRLCEIKCRTLIVWGSDDKVLDISCIKLIREKMINCVSREIITIPDAGHCVHQEHHEEVGTLLNQYIFQKHSKISSPICHSNIKQPEQFQAISTQI